MNKVITCTIFTILFSANAFAGGQQIDCESDFTNIRIRATYFSEQGEALLRDSYLEHGDYKRDLKGVLKIVYSAKGDAQYYEAQMNLGHFIVRIYSDKTFELLLGGRGYFVDGGECQLNTVGPF